jgi:hypothetical protein
MTEFVKESPSAIFIYIDDSLAERDRDVFFVLGTRDIIVAHHRLTSAQ